MITHFTYKPFFSTNRHQEWQFSFFAKGTYFEGIYHYNGEIEWVNTVPEDREREELQSQLHELMLFHVYD